jgi:hypothetical protein
MTTPRRSTLLDLVQAVTAYATSDAEIVATVAYLINTGRVRLCGTFAGARIDLAHSSAFSNEAQCSTCLTDVTEPGGRGLETVLVWAIHQQK